MKQSDKLLRSGIDHGGIWDDGSTIDYDRAVHRYKLRRWAAYAFGDIGSGPNEDSDEGNLSDQQTRGEALPDSPVPTDVGAFLYMRLYLLPRQRLPIISLLDNLVGVPVNSVEAVEKQDNSNRGTGDNRKHKPWSTRIVGSLGRKDYKRESIDR